MKPRFKYSRLAPVLVDQLSPQAKLKLERDADAPVGDPEPDLSPYTAKPWKHHTERRYPFREMAVGNSFIVQDAKGKKGGSLRNLCTMRSKALGRIYRCIWHSEHGLFEIVRTK